MSTPIPLPPRSIMARWLVPLAIISAATGAMLLAGLDAMRPAVPVRVAPVVEIDSVADDRSRASPAVAAMPSPAASPAVEPARTGAATPDAASSARARVGSRNADPPRAEVRWVQAPGWIEPDPQPVIVSALRDGIVEEILALEGDFVERGTPVARLESRREMLEVAQAVAELARAQAERERFLAMAEQARTEEGQLPFLRAAAQARYDAAKDAADRAARLIDTAALGEAELVRLRNAMLEARAELEAIEPRARAIAASIRAADAEAAAATLVPEAALRHAELQLERSVVLAPIDGIVMEVHAVPGQNLFAGDLALGRAIVSLYDPGRLRVRADVPLADAAGLTVGQRARVTVEVLPDRVFNGVVSRLVHKADIQKNTVQVKVRLLDPSPELKPDMLARVRIEVAPPPPIEPAPSAPSPGSPARSAESGPAPPAPPRPPGTPGTPGSIGAPEPLRTPRVPGLPPAADSSGTDEPSTLGATSGARRLLLVHADAVVGADQDPRVFVVTGIDRGRGRIESRRVRIAGGSPRPGWLIAQEGVVGGDRTVLHPAASLADGAVVAIVETIRDPEEVTDAAR